MRKYEGDAIVGFLFCVYAPEMCCVEGDKIGLVGEKDLDRARLECGGDCTWGQLLLLLLL